MIYLNLFAEIIITFIEAFVVFDFCDLFVQPKAGRYQKAVWGIILTMIVSIFNKYSLISPIFTLIILFFNWGIQYVTRRKHPIRLIFTVLLYFAVLFILDYTFSLMIGILLHTDTSGIYENLSIQRTVTGLSSKLILFLLINLFGRITSRKEISSIRTSVLFTTASIFITVVATLMYLTQTQNMGNNGEFFMLLFFLLMLLMIIVSFYILAHTMDSEAQKQELQLIEQQNELLKKNLNEQEAIFVSWKKSIHDYKHKMLALENMLASGKYTEAKAYIDEEIDAFQDKAFFIHTGNSLVDLLLNNKMNRAKKNDISFTVNIDIHDSLKISDIHLSIILGNLIDNAIEAVIQEKERHIHVQISRIEEMLVLKVINNFSGEKIPNKTTKEESALHGIGLKSVQNIVDSYDGSFLLELKNGNVTALVVI